MHGRLSYGAFTLIELLVVIAIIAILAVVVVLTLNPAQLLAQSRDANRVSDMATLNSAIGLYQTDIAGAGNMGTSTNLYVSLSDTTSTCANLGLPALSGGSSYNCPSIASLRLANGQGWVPINFSLISSGAPFGSLPVDPTNQSSSGLYYGYMTNGTQFEILSLMESQKYKKNLMGPLGPGIDAIGSNSGTGPIGWWPFDEASNTVVYDASGNPDNGNWGGTPAGTSGYYSPSKNGGWAGTFNGYNNSVNLGSPATLNNAITGNAFTISAWVYASTSSFPSGYGGVFSSATNYPYKFSLRYISPGPAYQFMFSGVTLVGPPLVVGSWHFLTVTFSTASGMSFYSNGAFVSSNTYKTPATPTGDAFYIGTDYIPGSGRNWNGYIGDVRMFNRALSAGEIQSLYNAGK